MVSRAFTVIRRLNSTSFTIKVMGNTYSTRNYKRCSWTSFKDVRVIWSLGEVYRDDEFVKVVLPCNTYLPSLPCMFSSSTLRVVYLYDSETIDDVDLLIVEEEFTREYGDDAKVLFISSSVVDVKDYILRNSCILD